MHDPIERIGDAAKRLGINVWTLRSRAKALGFKSGRAGGRPKDGEVAGLRRSEWNQCAGARVRGRPKKTETVSRQGRRWTTEESARLTDLWGVVDSSEVRLSLGRTWDAIADHAINDLGLPSGLPRGWVSIKAAGRALGYDPKTILNIAARNGVTVRPHPCPARDNASRATVRWSTPHRCIELDAIREAVEHETRVVETIKGAADARGIHSNQLRRWLIASGVPMASPGSGSAVRLPTAVIDRVVAENRGRRVNTYRPQPVQCA